jgi:ketosteroid isomerase-like protein
MPALNAVRYGSLLLAALTCKPNGRAVNDAAGGAGDSAAPGQQAAVQAIRAMETRWRDVVARKDTAAIKTFYTRDAIYLPQDRPPAKGRDAVAKMWATGEFTLEGMRLERTPTRIEVAKAGDVANEIGTWTLRAKRKGIPMEGQGNYVTAWRKEGADWKIAAYMWNTGR